MRLTSKQLGDAGEAHALALLQSRGYEANLLRTNAPTYDLSVSGNGVNFFVSVKVSREKQHVRLGSRNAVLRLVRGNFVFAFLPNDRQELTAFEPGKYRLLILPAQLAKEDSLSIHDAYWAAKGGDANYSVMVKGYGSHHRTMWPKWLSYTDAWNILP